MGRHARDMSNGSSGGLGERVKLLRQQNNLTLVQLGHEAGLSHSFLSQVENSRAFPSITTLHDLARALGVNSSDLL